MAETSQKPLVNKVKDSAASAAADMSDAAAGKARKEAEAARDMMTDEAEKTADAAQAAADEFDPGSIQAKALEEVARQVDHLADQIRTTDIDRLARSVGQAAQRNPLMFVAGAALVGFAATRFMRSRDPERRTAYRVNDPHATGGTTDGNVWRVNENTSGGA
ncbi:hypothetical protein [Tateyamaria omphalii]|uniref:DUF3618 domain-containing protein n=1 Tax=Tateyamaria omphalii TaxID=299262 RepID=A0A1P8MR80_9RHOB|nr:hypothetical protein [Tateyamaria omphalii]APX10522.1 hypothetical protein BWR18_01525 [Tateyamaria omphalii]